MRKLGLVVLLLAVSLTGCYHAVINTGRPASGQMIENKWATGWIHGLIPPATVETAQRCPSGVARVETQMSFLNMVATFVTFGIFSPMTITVACAGSEEEAASSLSPRTAGAGDVEAALTIAAERSLREREVVLVRIPAPTP